MAVDGEYRRRAGVPERTVGAGEDTGPYGAMGTSPPTDGADHVGWGLAPAAMEGRTYVCAQNVGADTQVRLYG